MTMHNSYMIDFVFVTKINSLRNFTHRKIDLRFFTLLVKSCMLHNNTRLDGVETKLLYKLHQKYDRGRYLGLMALDEKTRTPNKY